MSRKPPHRPGITFEIGARLEALDYLQKWYPSRIEKIDYEEGKMLVHFERWSHRYDEWIYWDSNRLRPLERPSLRKEGLKDDEFIDFKPGEEVLARWTDCRYYPAKIEAINKEGTFTVQFYDGVIRCLKRIHIKSMPEDAKGQARERQQIAPELRLVTDNEPREDWIALVKAAAVAAAKSKAGVKPRTSVNSNKDSKEERKWFKVPSKKEETSTSAVVQKVQKKEEQPTSSETFGFPLVDVPKIAFVQAENALAHKRKNNLGNSFQAKRARLNKITGLLASKAVSADGAEKKEDSKQAAPVLEQEISPKPQSQKKNEADISSSTNIQKSALLPSNLSSGKARSKKCKQESGDSAGCLKPLKTPISPELIQVEDLTLVSQLPSSVINKTSGSQPVNVRRSFKNSHRRRRLQHLATDSLPHDSLEKVPSLSPVIDAPSVAHVSLEKHGLCLPLDLSSNLDVSALLTGEAALYSRQPNQEREENQIIRCHLSKAGTDGRVAPVASGALKIERKSKLEERCSSLLGKKKEKEKKEKKEKDQKSKQKKKKKKKKKSKQHVVQEIKQEHQGNGRGDPAFSQSKDGDPDCGPPQILSLFFKKGGREEAIAKMARKIASRKDNCEAIADNSLLCQFRGRFGLACRDLCGPLTDYSDFEDSSLECFDRCSSPFTRSSGSSLTLRSTTTEKSMSCQYPRAILSVDLSGENEMGDSLVAGPPSLEFSSQSNLQDLSDMEFLDDSSTESLLLSGDEYNQDFDSTNFEESQDEEDALNEIVRCICEMDEENGFMIQCEECLCWQHSACMGLLEDSIPEQYICYICRDPPGQRWSAKYLCDKDWLNNGHMCGLSFLKENYSHLNAKKIVSTHRLLADVYGVTEILHGLQLKIGILKNKHHPDLHLWACTGMRRDHDQITLGIERRVLTVPEAINPSGRTCHSQNHKEPPRLAPKMEETYIRSEHSYQKPSFGQDCKSVVDPTSSEDDDTSSFEHNQELLLEDKNYLQYSSTEDGFGHQKHSAEGNTVFVFNEKRGAEEHVDARLQWQLNLLTHIENVQNEVTSRMDLIEKEVDVLESWLDFTGELEPPDPLARLPQLKRRIKQLISDMGKVQQIATLCSV